MVKFYRKTLALSDFWVSSNDKLSDFYASSCQRGESAVPLLVIRLILFALTLAILVWTLVEGAGPYYPLFLTNWGIILIFFMLLSGLVVSFMAVLKRLPDSGELPWYTATYWFLFNVSVSIAFMITALYWILLFDADADVEEERIFWLDVVTHGFNSCIVLCELILTRTPVRIAHIYQPVGLGLWYAAFTAIYYFAGGTDGNGNPYIYEVLNWAEGGQAGLMVAISAAGLLLIYVAVWGTAICRDKLSTSVLRTTSLNLPH